MHVHKRALAAACLGTLTLALAAAGCGSTSSEPAAASASSDRASITLAYFKGAPTSAIPVLAKEKGFFQKRGVNVQLQPYSTGPAGVSLLLSGDADYASGLGPPSVVGAISQGACLKYLTADEGNVIDIVARPGVKLPNAGKPYPQPLVDLKGKKIGVVARGAASEQYIKLMLRDAGLDPEKDVTFVAVGGPATAAIALQRGEVDASYLAPPMPSLLGDSGYQFVVKLVGQKGNPLADLLQAGTIAPCKRVASAPEQVKRFCSAIWDAFDYAQNPANRAKMEEFFASFLGVKPAVANSIWEKYGATFPSAQITKERWDAQSKYLPKGTKLPDYGTAVYAPCATRNPNA